jgi:hypothetical protein
LTPASLTPGVAFNIDSTLTAHAAQVISKTGKLSRFIWPVSFCAMVIADMISILNFSSPTIIQDVARFNFILYLLSFT